MKMKKMLGLIAAATMIAGSLAGCGGTDNAAGSGDAGAATETAAAEDGASAGAMEGPITVVSREDGSGTRGAFIELFGVEEEENGE